MKSRDHGIWTQNHESSHESAGIFVDFLRCRAIFHYYMVCRDGYLSVLESNIILQPWANRGDMTSKLFVRFHRLFLDISGYNRWIWLRICQSRVNICSLVHAKAQLPINSYKKAWAGLRSSHVSENYGNHEIS